MIGRAEELEVKQQLINGAKRARGAVETREAAKCCAKDTREINFL
jgi:hypothetical protein